MAALVILLIRVSLCIFLLLNGVEAGRQARISGGEEVSIKDVPYMGTLRKLQNESMSAGSGFICVATAIQNRVLITTAFCIYRQTRENIVAVIGNTYIRGLSPTMKVLKIADWRWHGLYKYNEWAYDIALVFTSQDIVPVKGVIEYLPITQGVFRPNTRCIFCSWGADTTAAVLHNAPYIALRRTTSKMECYKRSLAAGVMCTYDLARVVDINRFDLGGPLKCNNTLAGVLLGNTSDEYMLFTDIYMFRKWINAGIYMHFNGIVALRASCFQWHVAVAIAVYLIIS
ncbi:PREDICTED: trypsin eta-like [Drosophila arizonae]|uniref:Trypsin eta-like n=1 Tax=Drosophila arizonae TaxID=7263 RepID=A0ABM1NQC4_DROAR|nr:PREDICTED: trypsin eta-like [Drosophila arizonae]